MRYHSEDEIHAVRRSFEDATISRDTWKHAEHLTVALCYVSENDEATAVDRMRLGIFKLLAAFEVDLKKEMPYHETMTVFWIRSVAKFHSTRRDLSLLESANELIDSYDKNYPMKFYTREWLFSDHARTEYVEPDIGPSLTQSANNRTMAS